MKSAKNKHPAKQVPRSRAAQNAESGTAEAAQHGDQLSPEFFDLICDWDPDAVNDDYYVTSSDFIELHSGIKKFLIRRVVWWAVSVCLGMSILAYVYR